MHNNIIIMSIILLYGNPNVTKLSKFKLKCENLYGYWINTNSKLQKVKAANSRVQNLRMSALTHLGKVQSRKYHIAVSMDILKFNICGN